MSHFPHCHIREAIELIKESIQVIDRDANRLKNRLRLNRGPIFLAYFNDESDTQRYFPKKTYILYGYAEINEFFQHVVYPKWKKDDVQQDIWFTKGWIDEVLTVWQFQRHSYDKINDASKPFIGEWSKQKTKLHAIMKPTFFVEC